MKVAVIGGGVVGTALAHRLSEYAADVLLFESGDLGQGASGVSFAWVNASSKDPGPYFDLCRRGMAAHRALAKDLGNGTWLHQAGHLLWSDNEERTPMLQARVHELRAAGYQIEMRPARVIAEALEPGVTFPSPDHPVVYAPEESWIDVPDLIQHLTRRAATLGAEIHLRSHVDRIETADGTVVGVGCADGRQWHVDAVVNAAGASAGRVGALVGQPLPMQYSPGLVVRLRAPGRLVHTAMHTPKVEIRPDSQGRILLHSRRVDALLESLDVDDNAQAVDMLMKLAVEVVPALRGSDTQEARIVCRPIPLDGLPSLGRLHELGGYYEAVTHSGVTLAPAIADLLSAAIIRSESRPELTTFSPDRFDRTQIPADTGARTDRGSAGAWNN
ncbi:MAG: FAD-dependent oxidoreductase [Nocardioides sp.]|uniref:NAD(P)/FAD-dependent oxidoreductase n=1 Tax=Nocardioides sp. TaxID=35761 RepID=UPI0039E4DA0C